MPVLPSQSLSPASDPLLALSHPLDRPEALGRLGRLSPALLPWGFGDGRRPALVRVGKLSP